MHHARSRPLETIREAPSVANWRPAGQPERREPNRGARKGGCSARAAAGIATGRAAETGDPIFNFGSRPVGGAAKRIVFLQPARNSGTSANEPRQHDGATSARQPAR